MNPYCKRYDPDECGDCEAGSADAEMFGLDCFEPVDDDEMTPECADDGSEMCEGGEDK